MKEILILTILLLQPLLANQYQFTFSQIFNTKEISLNDKYEWNGSITLNDSGEFQVVVTIYYKLDREWYWTDIELELNGNKILLHLDGRNHVITKNMTMMLSSKIKVKLMITSLLTPGVIFGNSTIRLIKVEREKSIQSQDTTLVIIAILITVAPIAIQFARKVKKTQFL